MIKQVEIPKIQDSSDEIVEVPGVMKRQLLAIQATQKQWEHTTRSLP